MKQWLNRMRKQWQNDDRGFTVVAVLVAMAFVATLGAMLLLASAVNAQMKDMERQGKANLYHAETALNQVRAEVQQEASAAMGAAYAELLSTHYGTTTGELFDEQFALKFKDKFEIEKFDDENPLNAIFDVSSSPKKLSSSWISYLETSIGADLGNDVEVEGLDNNPDTPVVLKGVTVTYTNARGFSSTVKADIEVNVRAADELYLTFGTLPAFALVAARGLEQPTGAGAVTIDGNIYAGGITTAAGTTSLTMSGAKVICGGAMSVGDDFTTGDATELWARRILVENTLPSTPLNVTLNGAAYVADDLELAGENVAAALNGYYYGFGDSTDNNAESSAILLNGKVTTLNMSNAKGLFLAGHSFIRPNLGYSAPGFSSDGDLHGTIIMGESISPKSNQLAYLIDPQHIQGGSNPYFDTENRNETQLLELLSSAVTDAQLLIYPVTGGRLVYFYEAFDGGSDADDVRQAANAHFAASDHTYLRTISDYLDVEITRPPTSAGVTLSGHALPTTGAPLGGSGAGGLYANLEGEYANLCVSLDRNISGGSGYTSPYDYYIKNQSRMRAGGEEFTDSDGNRLALVIKNAATPYEIEASTPYSIIVASGDVTVKKNNFAGLIIAGGKITIENPTAQVASDRAGVMAALRAKNENDAMLGVRYFGLAQEDLASELTTDARRWDMERIVTYQNWSKE